MSLDPVPISGGRARLASCGTVELIGRASAVLRLTRADDVELPETVAEDVTGGVLLLNDDLGRLLYLPYTGELVVAYRLEDGAPAYQPIRLPRDPDHGLRMATVRVLPNLGALHLTESTLAL